MVAYETFALATGILDPSKSSPIRLVEINSATNLNYNTDLEDIIEILMKSSLPAKVNMSIPELLDLPNDEFEMYYRVYKRVNSDSGERKAVDDLLKILQGAMGAKK
jgi:hypothetical protein